MKFLIFCAIVVVAAVEVDGGTRSKRSINWNGNRWAFGCDYTGNDIANAKIPGEQCGSTCAKTPGCTHYVWSTWNGGTCWMKTGWTDAFQTNDATTVCGWLGDSTVVSFKDVATGRCLDSNSQGNVYAIACNGGDFQKWRLVLGTNQLKNVATGNCLDSNGVNMYAIACNGGQFQQWLGSSSREIKNVANGKCLDSKTDGTTYPGNCNGGDYQKWASG